MAEKAAAGRFAIYRDVVDDDPPTRAIFEEILRDEVFHMNYTYTQLARVLPEVYRRQVWQARASRLWKRYLRVAAAVAGVLGTVILTIMYFVAARRPSPGWPSAPSAASRSAGSPIARQDAAIRRRSQY